MNKIIGVVVGILVIGGAVYFGYFKKANDQKREMPPAESEEEQREDMMFEAPKAGPAPLQGSAAGSATSQPQPSNQETVTSQPQSQPQQPQPQPQQQPEPEPQQPSTPQPVAVTTECNDSGCTKEQIAATKGAEVTITFKVKTEGVYYNGLDFRSSVVNTGTILPGASKTVSFTANSSFDFTPYWPASNIQKGYIVRVIVN